jgi:hypothetical protein
MKKITLLAVLVSAVLTGFVKSASAQYYFYDNNYYDAPLMFEFGASFGGMNCLTDVGGRKGLGKRFIKDLVVGNTRPNASVYLSATYKDAVAIRLEGTFGSVKAYDSVLKNVRASSQGRYERNLHFRSKITEIALIAEFHPLFIFINWPAKDNEPPKLSPYISAGIGYFSFNPQAKGIGDQWVDLEPLRLEGQGLDAFPERKPYKLAQLNFPLGMGVRYELSSLLTFRAELLYRILTTDYLDDVSTRYIDKGYFGNPVDGFGFTGADLANAIALGSNDRNNPGGPTGKFRKTQGGIRGDPKDNDSYFSFNLKLGLNIGRERIR